MYITAQFPTYWSINCIFILIVNNNNNTIFIVNEILGNNRTCICHHNRFLMFEDNGYLTANLQFLFGSVVQFQQLPRLLNTDSAYMRWLSGSDANKLARCCSILRSLSTVLWLWCCIISDYIAAVCQIQFCWSALLS